MALAGLRSMSLKLMRNNGFPGFGSAPSLGFQDRCLKPLGHPSSGEREALRCLGVVIASSEATKQSSVCGLRKGWIASLTLAMTASGDPYLIVPPSANVRLTPAGSAPWRRR
jgi:hypothetical protein